MLVLVLVLSDNAVYKLKRQLRVKRLLIHALQVATQPANHQSATATGQ